MNKLRIAQDGSFAPRVSSHTVAVVLAAAVAETYTVPDGAAYVFFASTVNFRAAFIGAGEALDLVTNGTFAADTDWTKGDGWTIAAGVGSCDGSQLDVSDLEQTPEDDQAVVEGRAYLVTFTVSNRSAGTVKAMLGGTAGTARSSNATFTEVLRAGADGVIALRADADFIGDVDTVSVVPVAAIPATDNTTGKAHAINPTVRQVGDVRAISLISADAGEVTMEFYESL